MNGSHLYRTENTHLFSNISMNLNSGRLWPDTPFMSETTSVLQVQPPVAMDTTTC